MTKPIICAVNGIACGAGMDLVTTADITIASERATLMDPHVSIGVTSGREGVRLARVLPLPVAMRLILMGKHESSTRSALMTWASSPKWSRTMSSWRAPGRSPTS